MPDLDELRVATTPAPEPLEAEEPPTAPSWGLPAVVVALATTWALLSLIFSEPFLVLLRRL
jgi:hypothetical protein